MEVRRRVRPDPARILRLPANILYVFAARLAVGAKWRRVFLALCVAGKLQVPIVATVDWRGFRLRATPDENGVTDLVFTTDGKYLFSAGRDTRFRITRVEDGSSVAQIGQERGGQFHDWLAAIALSPDERRLAAADISGHIQIWDLG